MVQRVQNRCRIRLLHVLRGNVVRGGDPGLRSVEDTLVDGVPAPYIGDGCCPTREVTEFIFS